MTQPESTEVGKKNAKLIEDWFGDILPENELQHTVMLLFAELFEEHVSPDGKVDADKIAGALIEKLPNSVDMFTAAVLSNRELISQICEQLKGMSLEQDPVLPQNKRHAFKICNMVFPGEKYKHTREKATGLIKNYYDTIKLAGNQVPASRAASSGIQNQTENLTPAIEVPTVQRTNSGNAPAAPVNANAQNPQYAPQVPFYQNGQMMANPFYLLTQALMPLMQGMQAMNPQMMPPGQNYQVPQFNYAPTPPQQHQPHHNAPTAPQQHAPHHNAAPHDASPRDEAQRGG